MANQGIPDRLDLPLRHGEEGERREERAVLERGGGIERLDRTQLLLGSAPAAVDQLQISQQEMAGDPQLRGAPRLGEQPAQPLRAAEVAGVEGDILGGGEEHPVAALPQPRHDLLLLSRIADGERPQRQPLQRVGGGVREQAFDGRIQLRGLSLA
ncbi:MAG: hypothetical protein H0W11_06780, partial [Gemmatimonadetes bacterium]|nr:hypothetical protein [Gemmatimonadota bacterium]